MALTPVAEDIDFEFEFGGRFRIGHRPSDRQRHRGFGRLAKFGNVIWRRDRFDNQTLAVAVVTAGGRGDTAFRWAAGTGFVGGIDGEGDRQEEAEEESVGGLLEDGHGVTVGGN